MRTPAATEAYALLTGPRRVRPVWRTAQVPIGRPARYVAIFASRSKFLGTAHPVSSAAMAHT